MTKRVIEKSNNAGRVQAALADYQNRSLTSEFVADRHGISAATLTVWAKKAGMKLRQRGRKRQESPTPRQLEIVKLASVYKYDQVGKRYGMKKQSIHRIVKRWRNWAEPHKAPFDPGDILLWRGKRMLVLNSNRTDGTLKEEKTGKLYVNFAWNGGRMPKKVGFNPRYAKPTSQPAMAA